jgi:DNA-binding GntR family transcriptional regulator
MSAIAGKTGKSGDAVATPSVIAGVLREAIVLGEIEAGTPLRQDRIAADFGVSHIPVREALQELVAGGLAVFIRNRVVVVSELSVDLAWELTEYRCLLEGQMARWAVPALTSQDLAEARKILDRLDRTTKTAEILSLNTAFHAALFRPANRPFFLKSIEAVRPNWWRCGDSPRDSSAASWGGVR